jgi:hypothetical protein
LSYRDHGNMKPAKPNELELHSVSEVVQHKIDLELSENFNVIVVVIVGLKDTVLHIVFHAHLHEYSKFSFAMAVSDFRNTHLGIDYHSWVTG